MIIEIIRALPRLLGSDATYNFNNPTPLKTKRKQIVLSKGLVSATARTLN